MAVAIRRIVPAAKERLRLASARRDPALRAVAAKLQGAVALEPGGPSSLFGARGLIPIYPRLAALDTLDYAERTLWSHAANREIEPRRQLIAEAGKLGEVPDGAYDAVLASHVLEHLANPLGALAEWRRVVGQDGHILLIVPEREGTFDHRRPVTTLEHVREDAERDTGEDDLTHLPEILRLHDLARDPGAGSRESFERRCHENLEHRAMHHHVFDARSIVEVCHAAALDVQTLSVKPPFHIVCLCRVAAHRSSTPTTFEEPAKKG
ncbi:MAG TPA: methyltransferase domain-containing protein [Solirubrobacteraceae bacterium]|jgi:SAM-dependent methyltransferase